MLSKGQRIDYEPLLKILKDQSKVASGAFEQHSSANVPEITRPTYSIRSSEGSRAILGQYSLLGYAWFADVAKMYPKGPLSEADRGAMTEIIFKEEMLSHRLLTNHLAAGWAAVCSFIEGNATEACTIVKSSESLIEGAAIAEGYAFAKRSPRMQSLFTSVMSFRDPRQIQMGTKILEMYNLLNQLLEKWNEIESAQDTSESSKLDECFQLLNFILFGVGKDINWLSERFDEPSGMIRFLSGVMNYSPGSPTTFLSRPHPTSYDDDLDLLIQELKRALQDVTRRVVEPIFVRFAEGYRRTTAGANLELLRLVKFCVTGSNPDLSARVLISRIVSPTMVVVGSSSWGFVTPIEGKIRQADPFFFDVKQEKLAEEVLRGLVIVFTQRAETLSRLGDLNSYLSDMMYLAILEHSRIREENGQIHLELDSLEGTCREMASRIAKTIRGIRLVLRGDESDGVYASFVSGLGGLYYFWAPLLKKATKSETSPETMVFRGLTSEEDSLLEDLKAIGQFIEDFDEARASSTLFELMLALETDRRHVDDYVNNEIKPAL